MKYMYRLIFVVSFPKFCFDFASPGTFHRVTKRAKDALDNTRKIVLRNCGMWIAEDFLDLL